VRATPGRLSLWDAIPLSVAFQFDGTCADALNPVRT